MHRVRIRVPKEALVVAALVLAVVIPSSRPAYTWLRRISANKQLNISDRLARPDSSTDPQVLLAEANRLYWLNNGPKAAPLYAKAEKLFADRGDTRNQLYAQIGHLRSEAETMSFVDLSRFLNDQLQSAHCGLAWQHRGRNRRSAADELPDSRKAGSRLQPYPKASRAWLSKRGTDSFRSHPLTQIDFALAGGAVRIRGQIDPGRYRRAWSAPLSRAGCTNGERAHRERGRDGRRVRGGKQAGNNRGHQNTRSATQRWCLQSRARLYSRTAGCRVSHLAGEDVGERRH